MKAIRHWKVCKHFWCPGSGDLVVFCSFISDNPPPFGTINLLHSHFLCVCCVLGETPHHLCEEVSQLDCSKDYIPNVILWLFHRQFLGVYCVLGETPHHLCVYCVLGEAPHHLCVEVDQLDCSKDYISYVFTLITSPTFSRCKLCVGWNPSLSVCRGRPAGLLQRLHTIRNTFITSPTFSRCILCVGWNPSPSVWRGRPAGLLQRLHIIRIYFDYLTDIF